MRVSLGGGAVILFPGGLFRIISFLLDTTQDPIPPSLHRSAQILLSSEFIGKDINLAQVFVYEVFFPCLSDDLYCFVVFLFTQM